MLDAFEIAAVPAAPGHVRLCARHLFGHEATTESYACAVRLMPLAVPSVRTPNTDLDGDINEYNVDLVVAASTKGANAFVGLCRM